MKAKALTTLKLNLFDKQFLVSRIACLAFISLLFVYMVGTTGIAASAVCISLILLFVVQFIFQFQVLNIVLGGIMFLLGVYFSMAVWSEFIEFEVVTQAARQLLIVGWGGCAFVISLAVFMVRSALLQD